MHLEPPALSEAKRFAEEGLPDFPEAEGYRAEVAESPVAKMALDTPKCSLCPLTMWGMLRLRAYKGDFANLTSDSIRFAREEPTGLVTIHVLAAGNVPQIRTLPTFCPDFAGVVHVSGTLPARSGAIPESGQNVQPRPRSKPVAAGL